MSNRNRRQPNKKPVYTGSPWANGAFDPSGFNPFIANAMHSQYIQTPFNSFVTSGQVFNRNYNDGQVYGSSGQFQNERNQSYGSSGQFQNQRNQNYESSSRFGNQRNQDYGSSGRFQTQRNQNYNSGGKNRRNSPRGRNNNNKNFTKRKRNNNDSGGNRAKTSKTSEPYNPAEPTGEEDDDRKSGKDSDNEQSSKFGANAPSQDWKYAKKNRGPHYCTFCKQHFSGSFLIHTRSKDHRKNRNKKFPRCRFCRKTFPGTKEFEEHTNSEEHIKKRDDFQAFKEQKQVQANLSDSEDEKTALERYMTNQQEEEQKPEEDTEAVGTFHVVPLKVFLCKLCQKFFSNYTDGHKVHCRTPDHIQNYKVYFEGKEARAAERNRLKKEEQVAKKEQQMESENGEEKEDEEEDDEELEEETPVEQETEEMGEEEEEGTEEIGDEEEQETEELGEEEEQDAEDEECTAEDQGDAEEEEEVIDEEQGQDEGEEEEQVDEEQWQDEEEDIEGNDEDNQDENEEDEQIAA